MPDASGRKTPIPACSALRGPAFSGDGLVMFLMFLASALRADQSQDRYDAYSGWRKKAAYCSLMLGLCGWG